MRGRYKIAHRLAYGHEQVVSRQSMICTTVLLELDQRAWAGASTALVGPVGPGPVEPLLRRPRPVRTPEVQWAVLSGSFSLSWALSRLSLFSPVAGGGFDRRKILGGIETLEADTFEPVDALPVEVVVLGPVEILPKPEVALDA